MKIPLRYNSEHSCLLIMDFNGDNTILVKTVNDNVPMLHIVN